MKEIIEIFRRFILRGTTFLGNVASDVSTIFLHRFNYSVWTFWANFFSFLRGQKIRYTYDYKTSMYIATDKEFKRYFKNKALGYDFYSRGIEKRIRELADVYFLDEIPVKADDLIVDCGANIGDFYLYFKSKGIEIRYRGYEPSLNEFTCLSKNIDSKQTVCNKGLWNMDAVLPFYVSSDGGDSSFIEPVSYTEKLEVPIVRLDSEVQEHIKLLKLEAEGAEPEVLEGCGSLLQHIEYITADLGPERGVSKESTLVPVTNYLLARNFELLAVGHARIVGLYRNKAFV